MSFAILTCINLNEKKGERKGETAKGVLSWIRSSGKGRIAWAAPATEEKGGGIIWPPRCARKKKVSVT